MIQKVIDIAKKTSLVILEIYDSQNFDIEIKDDDSPITKADLIANEIIIHGLRNV